MYAIFWRGKENENVSKHGFKDNIKMDLTEVGWSTVDYIQVPQAGDEL
jgi:hypothetical protein